jgi:hypothetical protein
MDLLCIIFGEIETLLSMQTIRPTEDQLLQKIKLKVSLHYEQVNLGGQQVMYTFATIGGLMPDSGIGLSLFVLCFDIVCCSL